MDLPRDAELHPSLPTELPPDGLCASLLGHSWESLGNHVKALLYIMHFLPEKLSE